MSPVYSIRNSLLAIYVMRVMIGYMVMDSEWLSPHVQEIAYCHHSGIQTLYYAHPAMMNMEVKPNN
jgi:hypothetical protein